MDDSSHTFCESVLIFKALADDTRLSILHMLHKGELCACRIQDNFDISQPTLSYHMKILTACGLVKGYKDGLWMIYSINRSSFVSTRNMIDYFMQGTQTEFFIQKTLVRSSKERENDMLLKPSGCCEPGHTVESKSCCEAGLGENSSCCCNTTDDTSPHAGSVSRPQEKILTIDFFYLDLNVCERCMGTGHNLEMALESVSSVLQAAGYSLKVNKVNITSEELAIKYEFTSSPTIRINGKDIALEFRESNCKDCGDLCGDSVDCRVFIYEGVDYDTPPKEMIINAILKEVYGPFSAGSIPSAGFVPPAAAKYTLPDNLRKYFQGHQKQQ